MRKVILNDVIDIISGGTPKTDIEQYWNGEIGWLSVVDFNDDNRYVYSSEKKITSEGMNNSSTKMLNINDVIISARGTVGALAQIGKPMCFNQSCFGLRGKDGIITNDYLYYALKNYISNIRKRTQGSVFETINLLSFKLMDINIHENIDEQNKISNVLGIFDSKIALNNKINQELEQMAKTLYDYWFVQFDFPDEKGRPYKSANGKMVYNEVLKREIPLGWEVKNIFDVLDIQYGYPFDTELFTEDKGLSVVRIRDILTNSISAYSLETVDEKYKLQEGDLVIGMDGNFHMNYWNEIGAYLNQRCVRIRCKEGSALSVIQAKYSLEPFIKKKEQNISRTTVGHLSDKDFKSQYILVPKKNSYFNPKETFESILYKITNNNKESKKMAEIRDFLLPLLMNGQVTISSEH